MSCDYMAEWWLSKNLPNLVGVWGFNPEDYWTIAASQREKPDLDRIHCKASDQRLFN